MTYGQQHERCEALTKDEAIRLIRENSWAERGEPTCGHTGCEDHPGEGPRMIHTYSGFGGYDTSLEVAEEAVREAVAVEWVEHLLQHDLAIKRPDGHVLYFDVRRSS